MKAETVYQLLDEVDYGMLLVGADAAVRHVNRYARRELDDTHPLRRYFDAGLQVSINTDNRLMSGTDLVRDRDVIFTLAGQIK